MAIEKNFDQRHLAFGSPKLRLVTSVAECARRYSTDKENNTVRERERKRATIFGYVTPDML